VLALVGAVVLPLPLGSADGSIGAHGPMSSSSTLVGGPVATPLDDMLEDVGARARAIQSEADQLELLLSPDVGTIRGVLARHGAEPELAALIAGSLVHEGRRTGIAPRLLLAVMLVENPWIDPDTTSHMGAIGLMQVMPFHAGAWECPPGDLTVPEINICHGARVLAHALRRTNGDLDRALLRYNGCVVGANTRDCHQYPSWVRRARASVERAPDPLVEEQVPAA
jgi:hypothetical protein